MRKLRLLKYMLCLTLGLVCQVAWAQTDPVSLSQSTERPEHLFVIKNANGLMMTSYTSPTETEANAGKFAFYEGDVENSVYIYSVDRQKWVSYTKAASYANGTGKATLVDDKASANAWNIAEVTRNSAQVYQFAPYNTTSVAAKYMNWYGGKDYNALDNTTITVGLWQEGATADAGSAWIIKEVVVYDYIAELESGVTVTINGVTYENGDVVSLTGALSPSEVVPSQKDGKFAVVNVDNEKKTISVTYYDMPALRESEAYTRTWVYPMQQANVGEAMSEKSGSVYTLYNKVLAASFLKGDNAVYFLGSKAMDLMAGTELFVVGFGEGEKVAASQMTLKSFTQKDLPPKQNAIGGAEHYNGKALEAVFGYTYKGEEIEIIWRAVLRDGSHYLRTEMELKGVGNVDMYDVIAMTYNVDGNAAGSKPATVGNTRGKVIMSNKIFAGLETPTAYNTAGASDDSDSWELKSTPVTDNLANSAWTQQDIANVPMRIQEVGGSDKTYYTYSKEVDLKQNQKVVVTLTYKSGAKRFDIDGVVLLDGSKAITASDYHHGYTGSAKENNSYSFTVPNDGKFSVQMYIDGREGDIVSTAEFKVEVYEAKAGAVINTDIVNMQGRWSRNVTLKAGETWKVSAVVGLIAQDGEQDNDNIHLTQKRRSFLAYSERERAVPWRAFPCYISWYELNINRNNAAPGSEHTNMQIGPVMEILAQWKEQMYDRYGMGPASFIIDDGWDNYGTWTFHSAFPNQMRDMAAAAADMGAGVGAWLGPVGGYGQSGDYRRAYWNERGGGMQLSNPDYYATFLAAAENLVKNQHVNGKGVYNFFKFDGISAQFSATGPDNGDTGNENAEGIIRLEQYVRENLKEDIFFNTTVGTWASPFWYQISDATWRQENDHDRIGNNSHNREKWITYRDNLVHQNYVTNSPICPINTLMTHGFILTEFGPPAGDPRDYKNVLNELRCAFVCGSGMVELYNDYKLMNSIEGGALWADLAECIAWQKRNADVLPDAHWVGGDPWTGSQSNVYGWASWNGTKSTLALRNGSNDTQNFVFTLRQALNIPKNVTGSIILRSSFGVQEPLLGLTEGVEIGLDQQLTVTLPGSSVYAFDGIEASATIVNVKSLALTTENDATEATIGGTLVVKAAVNADATFPALTWTSSDPEVATVVGGLVVPKKEGNVTITATAKDGAGMSSSVTLTVVKKVDMDAPVVTDLRQLSKEKVYTLKSTRAFLFYKSDMSKLCSSTGKSVGSVTFDNTDPNQQFRIEKKGENYYLFSVGAEKYVKKDGTYADTATDALTLSDVSADRPNYPWQLALGGNGMNSQAANQTDEGIVLNSWTTTDDGNCYTIEVAVPKSYDYTIHVLGTQNATVTYGGKEYQNGGTFTTKDALSKSDFTASAVDGMFSVITIDGNNIYASYFANATKFYTIKGGHGGYVSLGEGYHDSGNLLLTKTDVPMDNKGLWTFVAQDGGGYRVYNYSTGLSKVLGITGTESDARTTMVALDNAEYKTLFSGVLNLGSTDASVICISGTGHYWNKRGNYLALWETGQGTALGDTGCKFFIIEVDPADYSDTYIHEISEIAGVASFQPKNPNTLWYKTSAEAAGVGYPWMEYALPLGNGELGCMVFGGVAHEELQFNEKTLWSGPANTVGAADGNRTFMNFGSLVIANNDASIYTEGVTDYVRYLDIEEGIAGVEFKNANGTKQVRKYFSSAPDQVIVGQYKSEGEDKMNLVFSLEPGSGINASKVTYEDGMAYFTGAMTVKYAARLHVVADDDAVVTATNSGIKVNNATEVTFYLKGATNFDGDVNSSSYFTSDDAADVNASVKTAIETAAGKGFEALESAHVEDFTAITKRMTLNLGLTTPTVDTKTLVDNYYPNNSEGTSTQNDHLFLEQLYFHYGRYLAISSNRKDIAAPNNLQGIWNDRGSNSPWNSDIHTNINIQMNYWPTEITNLSDLHKPFVNFILRGAKSEGWKQVANNYNDGYGWSVLTETSLYNSMSTWGSNYLVANVWYTSHLWSHWRYTQDKEFLKKAFPVMWDCAEFWFHRLIEDRGFDNTKDEQERVRNYTPAYKFDPDGTFVAPNEFSAEQHDNESEDGTAHAQQMIYYLFTNLKEAIDILGGPAAVGLTDDQVETLNEYLAKTDQGLHTEEYTGSWGATYNGVNTGDLLLREWKYSPFDISNDKGHRHMSHMMALFPMDQITPESEYFTPAVNSLKLRGDVATGWSMGWKVNLWARAQDGDHAHIIIKNALKHSTDYGTNAGAGGIYYNLFDSHAPFQIDGNFGVCSGIAEMLMQSAHGYINILPALPTVWERTGEITGMKAIGNFTVDFNWQNGKAQQVTIVSNAGAPLKVRCKRGAMDISEARITVDGKEVVAQIDENGIATIPNVKENDEVVIDFTKRRSVAVKVYTPGARVTTLEPGKKYFIYDTAINGTQDRTGFLFDNGSGMGHTKKKPFGDNSLKTTNESYLWEVVATETEGQYYIKAADGGYVNASGKTDNASAQILNIIAWSESDKKGDANSENADGSTTSNANIGSDVFTIYNGNTCWNGETNSFVTWSNAHPYAFYEIEEESVLLSDASPLPGHTYYIYCDNDKRQYFYNDGGTLRVSEKRVEWSNEYLFTCSFDGTYFQFKNAKGKYLGHKALSDNAHNFELAEYLDGVNLKTPGLSSGYFVMKNDNTFSQANRGDYAPASTDYSTVYKFEEFLFPVDGETYYIYSDTYHDGAYVNRYMYTDGSNLKLNTSLSVTDAYKWTCKVTDDGYVQFQNGAGKYLKHKGVQDTPYNFTLNKYNANHAIAATLYSVADSRYFVVKNDGSAFDQSTGTYNQTSGDWCTDFVFMPVSDVKILTVNSSHATNANATWNGETKALPASWAVTPQMVVSDATLSITADNNHTFLGLTEGETSLGETVEITSLTENRTITANFSLAFFSGSTDTKDLVPVRIRNVRNNTYTLRLNASESYSGKAVNSGVAAYGENEIWYLVGTEESFKIYNRVSGTDLHIVLANTNQNAAASMNTTTDCSDFCLVAKDNGYTISPKANTGQSLNMHGGAGHDIKLYASTDGGATWTIEKMDVNKPLTLNVEVDKVWESSPRVAELTLTIGGIAGQTRILGDVEGQQLFIPLGASYEVSSMTYRGYTYNGFTDNDGVLTASYTANDERTLFYTPRDGHPYRIPAIATAPNGDIFAICDYRPCGNDIGYGEVDLVCRVSSDNGVTWTEERTIADGLGHINDGIWKMGFGDPAIVADRESNKVLVMSVCGNRTCWDGNYGDGGENENPNRISRLYITYDETKKEWVYDEPEEVTYDIYPLFDNKNGGEAHVASMFIGAGKICQSRVVKKGDYYRLYCSVWAVTKSIRTHHNYVIYSDDFGQTWNVLGELGKDANPNQPGPAFGGNEPKCEELPDGTVVLSSRKGGGRYFNLFTFDDDTYTTGSWGTCASSNDIAGGLSFGGNSTNGEIYKVKAIRSDGKICDIMLQSVPTGSGRSDVAIFYKEMEYNEDGTNKYTPQTFATGWTKGIHVSTKESCYSTMILQADGRIGFFFEETPGGYCMVYIPYTIEDVTGGAYSLYNVNSTIGEYEIGTFYASEAMQIPEGVKAYVAIEAPVQNGETSYITMSEVKDVIPAKTGAVLRGAADTYNFIPSISYGQAVDDNMMVGYEAADNKSTSKGAVILPEISQFTTYVLTVQNEKAGFYRKEANFNVSNNKAYLKVPKMSGARSLVIRFGGDDATGIFETESGSINAESKEIYDLSGRRVQEAKKGIYVVDGKKIVK